MKRSVGVYLAPVHLAAFLATLYVASSSTEQVSLIWLFWCPIDLPWSLFYWIGGEGYTLWVEGISQKSSLLATFLYAPHLIHGVIGTVWWYFLPSLVRTLRHRFAK